MATTAVNVQAVAAKGAAHSGNNSNADILVLVTDPHTGAGITSLVQANFQVVDHFGFQARLVDSAATLRAFTMS